MQGSVAELAGQSLRGLLAIHPAQETTRPHSDATPGSSLPRLQVGSPPLSGAPIQLLQPTTQQQLEARLQQAVSQHAQMPQQPKPSPPASQPAMPPPVPFRPPQPAGQPPHSGHSGPLTPALLDALRAQAGFGGPPAHPATAFPLHPGGRSGDSGNVLAMLAKATTSGMRAGIQHPPSVPLPPSVAPEDADKLKMLLREAHMRIQAQREGEAEKDVLLRQLGKRVQELEAEEKTRRPSMPSTMDAGGPGEVLRLQQELRSTRESSWQQQREVDRLRAELEHQMQEVDRLTQMLQAATTQLRDATKQQSERDSLVANLQARQEQYEKVLQQQVQHIALLTARLHQLEGLQVPMLPPIGATEMKGPSDPSNFQAALENLFPPSFVGAFPTQAPSGNVMPGLRMEQLEQMLVGDEARSSLFRGGGGMAYGEGSMGLSSADKVLHPAMPFTYSGSPPMPNAGGQGPGPIRSPSAQNRGDMAREFMLKF